MQTNPTWIMSQTTSNCLKYQMKYTLGHLRHPCKAAVLLGPNPWHRVTSKPFSKKNVGWVWAPTEASSCARYAQSGYICRTFCEIFPLACVGRKPPWLVACASRFFVSNDVLLGHFAVKKIAVGESHSYLWNILREVRGLIRSSDQPLPQLGPVA